MKEFKGRVVTHGTAKAEAVVTHEGFNTLAFNKVSYNGICVFDIFHFEDICFSSLNSNCVEIESWLNKRVTYSVKVSLSVII